MSVSPSVVKPELQKGAQWRKVASRGDGTSTAELTCQAEGIPPVDFIWEKKGLLMDFANPRSGQKAGSVYMSNSSHCLQLVLQYVLDPRVGITPSHLD